MIDAILRDLRQPEYIHVLINPLPIYGLAMGLLGLIAAFFLRSRRAQIVTLIIVLVSARRGPGPSNNLGKKLTIACSRWPTSRAKPGSTSIETAAKIVFGFSMD